MPSIDYCRLKTDFGGLAIGFGFLIIALSAGVSGCVYSDAHSLHSALKSNAIPFTSDRYVIARNRHFVIPVSSIIYIPIPKLRVQPEEESEEVDRPRLLMEMQANAFAAHFAHVRFGENQMSLEEALRFAKQHKMNFLLYANIRHWQDDALLKKIDCKEETVSVETPREISDKQTLTACDWSFNSPIDKAVLSIWMYEVNSSQLVDVITIDSRSGALTFLGDTPMSLLQRPLSKLAQTYSAQ